MPKADSPTKAAVKDAPPAADPAAASTPDTTPPADPPTPAAAEEQPTPPDERVSNCVVNRGRGFHVGNAVNGKVCSYHAMHYDARGNRR